MTYVTWSTNFRGMPFNLETVQFCLKHVRYHTKKARRRQYLTEMNADYADDLGFLEYTCTPADSLLHSPEQAAIHISLHWNSVKTEFICLR